MPCGSIRKTPLAKPLRIDPQGIDRTPIYTLGNRSIAKKYMIVNSFCPFSTALISIVWVNSQWIFPFANDCINYLIGYSMDLTFPPPLYQLVEAFFLRARGLGPAGPGGPARAQKCFDQLIKGRGKGQIHWISNQIINAIERGKSIDYSLKRLR